MNIDIKINIKVSDDVTLTFDVNKDDFTIAPKQDVVRYLKGIYTNKDRFKSRFIDKMQEASQVEIEGHGQLLSCDDSITELTKLYEASEPYSYNEAFKIEDEEFRAMVFGSVDIAEMIEQSGYEVVASETRDMKDTKLGSRPETYELLKVNGEKIGIEDDWYSVRCTCPSTGKTHYIAVEGDFDGVPFDAMASFYHIPSNIIPHIVEIKRHGDVLLVGYDEDIEPDVDSLQQLTTDQVMELVTNQQ